MQRTALMPSLKRMSMGPRKKFDFFNRGRGVELSDNNTPEEGNTAAANDPIQHQPSSSSSRSRSSRSSPHQHHDLQPISINSSSRSRSGRRSISSSNNSSSPLTHHSSHPNQYHLHQRNPMLHHHHLAAIQTHAIHPTTSHSFHPVGLHPLSCGVDRTSSGPPPPHHHHPLPPSLHPPVTRLHHHSHQQQQQPPPTPVHLDHLNTPHVLHHHLIREPQPPLRPHPIHPKDPRRSQQQHPLQHYPSQRQLNPLPLANPSLQLSTNILVDTPSSYNTYEINDNNISDRVVSGGDVYGTTLIGTTTTTTNPSSISAGAGGAVDVGSSSSSTFLVPTRNSNTNTASSSLSAATVMGSSSPFLVPTRDSNTTTNTGPIYHEMSKSSGHVPSSRSSPDKDVAREYSPVTSPQIYNTQQQQQQQQPLSPTAVFSAIDYSSGDASPDSPSPLPPPPQLLPASSPSTEEDNRRKRKQRCRLCANHNIYKEVKGHKWYCEFREPHNCDKCEITRKRQYYMAEQQKLTRVQQQQHQHQDEDTTQTHHNPDDPTTINSSSGVGAGVGSVCSGVGVSRVGVVVGDVVVGGDGRRKRTFPRLDELVRETSHLDNDGLFKAINNLVRSGPSVRARSPPPHQQQQQQQQ